MLLWKIDTGAVGVTGVPSKELRQYFEGALDHFIKTAQIPGPLPGVWVLMSTAPNFSEVVRQMNHGIEAVCALASAVEGNVTATVSGHYYKDHPDGIDHRLSVQVDKARPNTQTATERSLAAPGGGYWG